VSRHTSAQRAEYSLYFLLWLVVLVYAFFTFLRADIAMFTLCMFTLILLSARMKELT
jgi:hypothetical protein